METAGKTLVVIVGPTAVGKSALAIALAKKLRTEIISADSRQFFKELTIGTAKPSDDELHEVPHHFINTHSIHQEYDAARFAHDALVVARKIFEQHQFAILAGGSGLYIKALCEGFDDIPQVPDEIRESIVEQFTEHGLSWLQQKMKSIDPEHFEVIDQQNPHRLIRALEVKMGTGSSIASFRKGTLLQHDFRIIKIGLELSREELYARIDERVDEMVDRGLFGEAEKLYGYKNHQALQTVGYQEIFDFMDGLYDREEALRLLKRNSRRYAKRQLTWFKKDKDVQWFAPDRTEEIMNYLKR